MNFELIPDLQLPLFIYGEPAENIVELLPAVWNATESLASPNPTTRQHGIDALLELGAQKASPLVAFMIATCLSDPDVYIRRRVAYILADLIRLEGVVGKTPEHVRKTVIHSLYHMREETIFGLLEIAEIDPLAERSICQILNACPNAGKYLGEIVSQWQNPLPIRQKAIHFVRVVGYLEVLPTLERILNRLEARKNGQYAMSFVPVTIKSDEDLLPFLRIAIRQLSAR